MNRELQQAFERYLTQRLMRESAITPGQKKKVIEQLREELKTQGRVPLERGPVCVDPKHPTVRAALEGRPVTVGGKVMRAKDDSYSGRMQALSAPVKILILSAIFLLPIIIVGIILVSRNNAQEVVAIPTILPTSTATSTVTQVTVTQAPSVPTDATYSPTLLPSPTLRPSPTPYAFSLSEGDAPKLQSQPASLELAGYSYVLSTGQVKNGTWEPAGAQWLEGSELRRIIALPYDVEVANTLALIKPGFVIKLRLRSGQLVKYKLAQTLRLQRQQIEILAEKNPSLAIILYGEASPERTVLIANAVQEALDFSLPEVETQPTLVPTLKENIITDTLSITHLSVGLSLEVKECEEVDELGGQKPEDKKAKYVVCLLNLTALPTSPASYSQAHFAITESKSYFESTDWVPPPAPVLVDALGSGELAPATQTEGRVAGMVTDDPILVWTQGDKRFIINLQP